MKTDNNEILYNAISNIDESTIASSLNYTPKNRTILKWSGIAACFCVVAVIFAVMYSNNQNDVVNDNSTVATPSVTTASGDCTDFHVYALPKSLSENDETKSYEQLMLSPVKTSLDKNAGIQTVDYTVAFKSDGYPYDERDTSYSGEIINQKLFSIAPDSIEFSIKSEIIAYYNVRVKNNVLSYQHSDAGMGWAKTFENIKISDNGYIIWRPTCERFSNEVLSVTGKEEPEYNSDINDRVEYSDAVKKTYDSIENFNDYFGDMLTFELHYKDGTSKNVVIDISLDKKGRYLLNYIVE